MNLLAMRTEVAAHGFDLTQFGSSRIDRFLNSGQGEVCSRVSYYVDEATLDFSTVAATASYPQPANLGKDRSLRLTGTQQGELSSTTLRTIDRSAAQSGIPRYYALDGANLHLYPTPDTVYTLELRYWLIPADLVGDTDVPSIPQQYHDMLIEYAVAQCFWAEDDEQRGQLWDNKFERSIGKFAADVKFPNDDAGVQVASMWDGPSRVGAGTWTRYGY